MTYVLQIAGDETLEIDAGLLKSLHFMMIKHDLRKNPGRWRPGDVYVVDHEGKTVYEGAPSDDVPPLIAAAMAHLNLTLIHPYSDGNGRMARCLQTLVLARDMVLAPVFSSIEEFLGRNKQAYYDVLGEVGAGSWHPDRDARPWIRFCLQAHFLQIRTLQRRRVEAEELWNGCVGPAEGSGLPERCAAALVDAAYGLRIRRGSYQRAGLAMASEEISNQSASRDLMRMVDLGLLRTVGERRARYYLAGDEPEALLGEIRAKRPPRETEDPFRIARERRQLSLT